MPDRPLVKTDMALIARQLREEREAQRPQSVLKDAGADAGAVPQEPR